MYNCGSLQLSECQNNITSLEHKLTASQQELAEFTEAKKQEVTLLQEKVSLEWSYMWPIHWLLTTDQLTGGWTIIKDWFVKCKDVCPSVKMTIEGDWFT